jgi:hypothetical protein
MDEKIFHYATSCSFPGCPNPPRYKVAASWSYGPLRELKNYGMACEQHRDCLLDRARRNRESLAVGDDETVGPVEIFELTAGHREVKGRPRP